MDVSISHPLLERLMRNSEVVSTPYQLSSWDAKVNYDIES